MKKQKILIGVGFSHAQGCAVVINQPSHDGKYELSTDALKDKYNKDWVSTDWVTENISWVGPLGKLLNVDKVYNFGIGGRGLEANIRMLRNYSFRVKDLSNHLIVMQLPTLVRVELIENYIAGAPVVRMIGDLIHQTNEGISTYLKYYYNEDFHIYRLINELYFLQDYMENFLYI